MWNVIHAPKASYSFHGFMDMLLRKTGEHFAALCVPYRVRYLYAMKYGQIRRRNIVEKHALFTNDGINTILLGR